MIIWSLCVKNEFGHIDVGQKTLRISNFSSILVKFTAHTHC